MPTRSHGRVKARQEQALERQKARDARGDAGQIALLDKGGFVAKRERARIAARLEKAAARGAR